MARKNAAFNRAAVDLLDVQPDDDVLEIGYGPGTALAMLAARAPHGTIAGVDLSARMLRQATRRNRRLVAEGRLSLYRAAAESTPFDDASFDRIIAVNNFHIWPDRAAALAEILRVLRPGGQLLLAARGAVENPGKYTPPGLDNGAVQLARSEIGEAGFTGARVQRTRAGRELVAIIAHKPAAHVDA
jgi:ubiquinone/menaquinone biosynthesis C-methylase UbiE